MTAPAPLSGGDARTQLAEALDEVVETVGLRELVQYASQEASYCCTLGCGSGACESCTCCGAGWCVSGGDGIPDDAEDRARWLEIAAEHNPVAAELVRIEARQDRLADERAAEELTTRAAQITARASEETDEQVVAALDDEAARLIARAASLRAASRGETAR